MTRVTFTNRIGTICPDGGFDVSDVEVTFVDADLIPAQSVAAIVTRFDGVTAYAEVLALDIREAVEEVLGEADGLSVLVRQIQGHGVTVEVS